MTGTLPAPEDTPGTPLAEVAAPGATAPGTAAPEPPPPQSGTPQSGTPETAGTAAAADALVIRLEGFEGPLDLLLELARAQKVDLARVSILGLVEQYLAVIEGARRVRLELAADWLVMAAWLTWLKSRLLLPKGDEAADEGALAADVLAARLAELARMRAAAAWLGTRPQLGRDVFARGAPESLTEIDRSRLALDVAGLIRAYLAAVRRAAGQRVWKPSPLTVWTVKDALERLARLVGSLPDWSSLEAFLPIELISPGERRAAMASTFVAGLEMARGGLVRLRQSAPFEPIMLRAAREGEEDRVEEQDE
jgi:segregation and condensation protein A